MREIQIVWCETHGKPVLVTYADGAAECVDGLDRDCVAVPMLLVPKDAPSITVNRYDGSTLYRIAPSETQKNKPPGRYVLIDEEER